jgi:hypothetical protein
MATMIAESRLGPEVWRNPNAGVVLLITAMEMGLTIGQAFRGMYAVNGMPGFTSGLAVAIVRSHPECEYLRFVESTDQRATCRTKRRSNPEPCTFTYTIEDAKRAGFLLKEVWQKNPADMLRAKAALRVCRMEYQDILFGFTTREEAEEGLLPALDEPATSVQTIVQAVTSPIRVEPAPEPAPQAPEPQPAKSRRAGKRTPVEPPQSPAQPTPPAAAQPAQPTPPAAAIEHADTVPMPPPAQPTPPAQANPTPAVDESAPWAQRMMASTSVPELDDAAASASLDFNAPEAEMDALYNKLLAKLVGNT